MKTIKGKGDCLRISIENTRQNKEWLFCYAYVLGRGVLAGKRFLHAWNEFRGVAIDMSNNQNIGVLKEKYYGEAKIKNSDVTRQTSSEVIPLLLKHKNYGGWIK